MLTAEDWRTVCETALDNIDRDSDPRPLGEWFVDFARALRDVAHETFPGLDDDSADDPIDALAEYMRIEPEDDHP